MNRALRNRAAPFAAFATALAMAVTLLAPVAAEEPVPITIARVADLGFGAIVVAAGDGSVTVGTGGQRSAYGGVALGSAAGVAPATFTISGEPSTSFGIVLPTSATLTNGSAGMTVDGFTSAPSGSGLLGSGGTQELAVGATLQVGAQQAQGSYTGTFLVTVAYD